MIFEFLGMPRSGKTTQIKRLVKMLQGVGKSCIVAKPEVRFEQAGSLEKFHLLTYRNLFNLYDMYCRGRQSHLIFDRGFYDRLVFLRADQIRRNLSDEFVEGLSIEIKKRLNNIDTALLLRVNPEISLNRLEVQKTEGEHVIRFMNNFDTLEHFEGLSFLFGLYEDLVKSYPCVKRINCSLSKDEVTSQILPYFGIG